MINQIIRAIKIELTALLRMYLLCLALLLYL